MEEHLEEQRLFQGGDHLQLGPGQLLENLVSGNQGGEVQTDLGPAQAAEASGKS